LVGGKKSIVREAFNRGIGIVGSELRSDGRGEFRWNTAEETYGLRVRGKDERDGGAGGIRLVNRGEDLFHVLRTPLVIRRHAKGEEHGGRIAEESGRWVSWHHFPAKLFWKVGEHGAT
jgi:hypothetical protein